MAKTYYIQNTYTADLQVILKKADGRFDQNVIFPRYQIDRSTGQIISDGHLEVDEKLLETLNTNGAFKLLVEKKKLVIKTDAPLKAGSFEQLLDLKAKVKAQEETIAALRAEIAALKGENPDAAPASDDGLDKLKLEELKAKAKELGLDAEALKKKDDVIKLIREATEKAGA